MLKRNVTNGELAEMIKRGFDHTATKQELQELRKDMTEALRLVGDDMHDLKIAMGPLVRVVAALESDVRGLSLRLAKVERKVGLAR